jgi:hypothetical protein
MFLLFVQEPGLLVLQHLHLLADGVSHARIPSLVQS